ncbi:MmcQ/YjbR family DNA-binding protein [Stenoxybacter acetivorans]|uniref:MmcQ/YjbR family DNA-binding protein n=1 Tax=Stenoxybacter acetivorans TaxID=422441 RepID=UPI000560BF6D|nr:MmcQ/YjbR family DNA-binding protein [Stenoxybacter acetivorans]
MNYPWLDEYCLAKQGSVKEYKEAWNAVRYLVGGKMFALLGNDNTGRPIITLKLMPTDGDFLRKQFKDIVPGYYMNKVHWNSVYLDGSIADDVLREMIDKSYAILFTTLTKKIQQQITQ